MYARRKAASHSPKKKETTARSFDSFHVQQAPWTATEVYKRLHIKTGSSDLIFHLGIRA